ncbi:MAG: CPBP family intramembrane glutamic endopeptidase [Actinomycetes bacterium]
MQGASNLEIIAIVATCCLVIAGWVRWKYDLTAALVVVACSAAALACVWIRFELLPIESWRHGYLSRTLVIFAIPAAVAAVGAAWVRRQRKRRGTTDPTVTAFDQWAFLIALWLGPSAVIYFSQLRPTSDGPDPQWSNLLWWAGVASAIYITIPIVYAMLTRQRIRTYGLSLGFIKTEASLLLLVSPLIAALAWLASSDARFQATYPFYKTALDDPNSGWKLFGFEIAYGLSFVALEFFFRGFLVHAGSPILGVHSVAIMSFSYCLLHLGKPMPECAASLVGGLVLGFVSLRLKSIAVGVVAHLTLAWGVDAAVTANRPG